MRAAPATLAAVAFAVGLLCAPVIGSVPGLAYLDIANIFTANQRINAGLGLNIAPGPTGTLSTSAGLFERSRSVAMGDFTTPSFSAGNFTASSGSWTVTSGNVTTFKYALVGHMMVVTFAINGTTVGVAGGAPQTLKIAIPGGFTAATESWAATVLTDNGTKTPGRQFTSVSGTVIQIQRLDTALFSASSGATSIFGELYFEVQ